jgi:hypothetical protein
VFCAMGFDDYVNEKIEEGIRPCPEGAKNLLF